MNKQQPGEWDAVAEALGQECIPEGFGKCNGALTHDPVLVPYFPKGVTQFGVVGPGSSKFGFPVEFCVDWYRTWPK